MSKNNSSDNSATKRRNLKSYASRVFQESSVGLVSSVAETVSKRRKLFKLLSLIVCLTGFLYQSSQYLLHVLEYPTAVNIEVKRPNTFEVPAYTFCDNNRRLFCEKFPDRCEEPDETLCRKYPDYCGEKKSLKPKEEYYKLHDTYEYNLTDVTVELDKFEIDGYHEENVSGPHIRVKNSDILYSCYSLYDRVNNDLSAVTLTGREYFRTNMAIESFVFRVIPEEMFIPGHRAGVFFSLHSPFEAENPLQTGEFMKPGNSYHIYVSMVEEILEKSPYDTDCTNYTELWEKNGRSGPRSKNGCQQKCLAEYSMNCYGCVLPYYYFTGVGKGCENNLSFYRQSRFRFNVTCDEMEWSCYEKCKDDCRRTTFPFKIQDQFDAYYYDVDVGEISYYENEIVVIITIESGGVRLYKHSPKYMAVEVFSCIGGFIGIWLGISLLDFTDVFEGIGRIFHYSLKRTRITRKAEKSTEIEEK